LRQILINFLSNALKFTERGSITLTLARNTGAFSDNLPVAISVRDTGIGIADNKQTHVFEAFNQVDGSTSRRYGGTGLGLTISRELATLLGGRIEVLSTVGEGSTFTLLLPETLDADALQPPDSLEVTKAPAPGEAAAEKPALTPVASYAGHRVLLVDDDVHNLLELTPLLEGWSIKVTAAGDGQEAVDTLEDDAEFDLIIIDLAMPAMDGPETVKRIRQDARLQNKPVIGLTDTDNDEERQQASECGVNDFLTRPVAPDELKSLLDRYFQVTTAQDFP
jgi:CheY-like chemotaxis protein